MKFQPLINYIQQYVSLTDKEIDLLMSKISYRKYLKGQYIGQQGEVSKVSGFVVSGCTKMFYLDDAGNEHIIMFSIKDWWTGDLGSFITQSPADYHVQCIENTDVILIDYYKREELFLEIPKLERAFRIILEKSIVASQKRIVRNFSLTAKERYLLFKQQYPTIEQKVPQYMIASYLGVTKEFLSKIKKQILIES